MNLCKRTKSTLSFRKKYGRMSAFFLSLSVTGSQSAKYNSSPILYLDDDFWNRLDEEIVEELRHCYEKHGCNIEVSDFLNREYLLQKVLPRVYSDDNIVQLEKNHIVYRHIMDLAFAFYLPIYSESESELSCP